MKKNPVLKEAFDKFVKAKAELETAVNEFALGETESKGRSIFAVNAYDNALNAYMKAGGAYNDVLNLS